MDLFENLRNKIGANRRHIVLPEGDDPRIIGAAKRIVQAGIAKITLLGDINLIARQIENDDNSLLSIVDPESSNLLNSFCREYATQRHGKKLNAEEIRDRLIEPVNFAAMMVRMGEADGTLGGAVNSTAITMRAAFRIIGLAPGINTASSFFIMGLEQPINGNDILLFADCALVIEPEANQLADIAAATADSMVSLLKREPKIAMLSFSTAGSAAHPMVSKVQQATKKLREIRPDLKVDGEVQLDAAIVPAINKTKMPNSQTGGKANILVFPNLEAGNIGYKLTQRIGGASAIGPIMQGFAKPANDLSRGCDENDVYQMILMTAAQVRNS